jgi:2-polyprenyl-3-methyl-5-hydroxy-6-metoxy-1,4-benzoquinol methylase
MDEKKQHWDKIYLSKTPDQVSWTQRVPQTSLDFIHSFRLPKNAAIIDVGGGDSKLVDFLLDEGYTNITVLDISIEAIKKTQARLGKSASNVKWITLEVTEFKPPHKYDVWHDRATFHFLTTTEQIEKYVNLAARSLNTGGYISMGTFSNNGPTKCSGLEIKQYSEQELEKTLTYYFRKIQCIHEDHLTPFNTTQNFLFCSFEKAA